MARRKISTGIDIGTSHIRVVVSEHTPEGGPPIIIGVGSAESRGLRHGYIVNADETTECIQIAIQRAQKSSGLKIRKAFIAIGGLSLESEVVSGSVFVSRSDDEISDGDIKRAVEVAEESLTRQDNRHIIRPIPVGFKVDDEEVHGRRPVGLKGSRLEVKTLFITCLSQHLEDFMTSVENAGVQVEDVMASPLAASVVALNRRQKTAGCALANIGAETLSLVVFENNLPISLKVFPIGGTDITNDIALGLKIPLDEAEGIKHGSRISSHPKKRLEEIVEARLSDIFEIIDNHLKAINKSLLPGGVILMGGSAAIPSIEEHARSFLKLPSKVALPDFTKNTKRQINTASWAVAYGLCIMGIDEDDEEPSGLNMFREIRSRVSEWIKRILP